MFINIYVGIKGKAEIFFKQVHIQTHTNIWAAYDEKKPISEEEAKKNYQIRLL